MSKTKLEIIQETYDAYKDASKRGVSEESYCYYLAPNGNMCAFGRCEHTPDQNSKGTVTSRALHVLAEKQKQQGKKEKCFLSDYTPEEAQEAVDSLLKPEYRGHSVMFWSSIQGLHDQYDYFAGDTWSALGLARIEELKRSFANED